MLSEENIISGEYFFNLEKKLTGYYESVNVILTFLSLTGPDGFLLGILVL